MGPVVAPLPFIGRDRELGELRSLLAETRAGQGLAVTVGGEPGVGKTRLCEETLAEARAAGFLTCRTRGNPIHSGVPMAAISGLLRSAVEQLGAGERASVTAGLSSLETTTALGQAHPGQSFEEALIFDAVAELFKRVCSRQPVVAYIDGLECVDEPSLRCIAAIVDRLPSRPLLLLASTRRLHTRTQLALAADLAGAGRAIKLQRLTQESCATLVRLARPDLKVVDQKALVIQGEGLPMYFAGALTVEPGSTGPFDLQRAMRVQLDGLWAQLSEPGRDMSRLLAVAAGTVPEAVLFRLWPDPDGFTAALREVVDAEVVASGAAGICLRHASYGGILSARMLDRERREFHHRFAAELQAPGQTGSLPALADHLLQIADEVDSDVLQKALLDAAGTPGIADDRLCVYLERLLTILPADAEPQLRYQLYSRLGAAQQRLGKPESARASWRRGISDALSHGYAAIDQFGSAQTQLAFHEWETAAATESDGARHNQYQAALHRLIWTTRYGTQEQNLDAARAAIRLGEASTSGAALAELGYCFIAWADGRYEDAKQHALKARHGAQGDEVRSIAAITLSRIAALTGSIETSLEALETFTDAAYDFGLSYGECAIRSWTALTHHLAGDLVAAGRQLGPAVLLAAESGATPVIARTSLLTALLRAEHGDLRAAAAALADAQRVRGTTVWQADLEGLLALVQGMLALEAGNPERVPHEQPLTAGNYPVLTLMLPFLSGLAGLRTGDRVRVTDSLAMLDADPGQSRPVHALRMRLQGLALASSGETGMAARALDDTANTLDDCGLRLYANQARLEWAEVLGQGDAVARVVPLLLQYFGEQNVGRWQQRTRRLARSIGYVEDRPHRNGHTLSVREAEVVLKASAGLTNASIAEQLFLSERTVESHMRNVYKRLGLSSRVSLAAWAASHPEEFSTGTDTAARWPG